MKSISLAIVATTSITLGACTTLETTPARANTPLTSAVTTNDACITEREVVAAQRGWGEGIVEIGEVYSAGGDYVAAAEDHIDKFYGYDQSLVLFKPTLASVEQFRASYDGALSYFVGGNQSYPEDKGFAIRPWSNVRWENAGITNNSCNMAVAMGNYYFTPAAGGDETKVEYTIGYIKDEDGDLRMVVHKSSLPYTGG